MNRLALPGWAVLFFIQIPRLYAQNASAVNNSTVNDFFYTTKQRKYDIDRRLLT